MKSRTEDEADALRHGLSKPEDNGCINCGWAYPPCAPEQEVSYRYCTSWESTKRIMYWCRKWRHFTTVSNGIWPEWCNQDRTRKTQAQLSDYYYTENVRKRVESKANPRNWGSRGGPDMYSAKIRDIVKEHREAKKLSWLFYCRECLAPTPHTSEGCTVCQEYANENIERRT